MSKTGRSSQDDIPHKRAFETKAWPSRTYGNYTIQVTIPASLFPGNKAVELRARFTPMHPHQRPRGFQNLRRILVTSFSIHYRYVNSETHDYNSEEFTPEGHAKGRQRILEALGIPRPSSRNPPNHLYFNIPPSFWAPLLRAHRIYGQSVTKSSSNYLKKRGSIKSKHGKRNGRRKRRKK